MLMDRGGRGSLLLDYLGGLRSRVRAAGRCRRLLLRHLGALRARREQWQHRGKNYNGVLHDFLL
jgi:hypothetical protein